MTRGKLCSKMATKRKSKLVFKPEWKLRFLVCPAGKSREGEDDEMICVLCQERMKAKCSTATRHLERKHPSSKTFTDNKKARLVRHFENTTLKQQATMVQAMEPNELVKLAPYKLAFVINKHKMSFSSCSAFVEFATSADPKSPVFSRMASSRDTVTL